MAIINRLSKKEIRENFDHYGMMYGIVPVYVGDPKGEVLIAARNWCPEFFLDLMSGLFFINVYLIQLIDPYYQPMFFFKLTGRIPMSVITYNIPNTPLRINVYHSGTGWYLSKLEDGEYEPVSPLDAGYEQYPKIDSMEKLTKLAVWVCEGKAK